MAFYEYALRFCEKGDYLTHSEHLMIVSRKETGTAETALMNRPERLRRSAVRQ